MCPWKWYFAYVRPTMVLSVEHVGMNVIVNLNYLNTHYELGGVDFPLRGSNSPDCLSDRVVRSRTPPR